MTPEDTKVPIAPFQAAARRVLAGLHRVEVAGLVALGLMLIALPLAETVSRLLGLTLDVSAAHLPHVVVWLTLLGGLVAARRCEHLCLATTEIWHKSGRLGAAGRAFGAAAAAAVVLLLAYASLDMVAQLRSEHIDGLAAGGEGRALPVGIPLWVAEVVIPVALSLTALRFVLNGAASFRGRIVTALLAAGILGLCSFDVEVGPTATWVLAILVVGSAVLGAPIFTTMAGIALVLYHADGVKLVAVPLEMTLLLKESHLAAIPMLTICGYLLAETSAAQRLVRFFRACLGFLPGGMAILVAAVCGVFTALTGGSGVTVVALGGLTLAMLREDGYSERFSLGHVTASSSLGLLFPPSLPVIIYAVVVTFSGRDLGLPELDPKALYTAGLLPGFLMIAMVAGYGVWVGRRRRKSAEPTRARPRFSLCELADSARAAKWELSIPVLILGLFFLVGMPIVEVASIAALYTLLVEVVMTRDIHWRRDLPGVLVKAGSLMGAILLLLGTAKAVSQYCIANAELHKTLLAWVTANVDSKLAFLLGLNLLLLFLGSVLEVYSALAILPPLLAPIAFYYGVDPIHMGIIFLANIELGFLTPPVGLNLFLASARFERPVLTLYRCILPYLAIMFASVMVITYVPAISSGVVGWLDPGHGPAVEEKRQEFMEKMRGTFGPSPANERRLEEQTKEWEEDLDLEGGGGTDPPASWEPPSTK